MIPNRIGTAVMAAACLLGIGACSRTQNVSDAQLTALLRTPQSAANDPNAPLDVAAVHCLGAWSGDPGLTKGLPPAVTSEAGKNGCRDRLQPWLADTGRNPDKLTFASVTTPTAAGRAAALLMTHRVHAPLPVAGAQPPSTFSSPASLPAPQTPATPQDVSAATAAVDELQKLCEEAKQNAGRNQQVARYASFCDKRIEQLRTRVSMVAAHGDARQVAMVTRNVQNMLTVGRRLAAAEGVATPQNPPQNQ